MSLAKTFEKGNYHEGKVRTDLDCHSCRKKFIAKIDFDIDGDHKIVCPYCGHLHWRKIKKGSVTDDRWGGGGYVDTHTEGIWGDATFHAETTTVAMHIRERFLK